MKPRFSFIYNFLGRYGYTTKIRILIFLGVLYGVFLICMISYLQLPPFRQYISNVVVVISLLSFLLMYATRAIRRPLENLKNATQEFVAGDLSIRVPVTTHDEVADITRAFNDMAELFEDNMFKIDKCSSNLVESTAVTSSLVKQLDSAVVGQEDVMHKMSVRIRETMVHMNHFFYSLNEVSKVSDVTAESALLGRSNLNEMEKILQQMKDASTNIVDTLIKMKEQLDKVKDVIGVLVEIADQSNLLFLNTAIKASKAGLEGAGFAIIAENIRELADRTSSSILGIEQTLNEIVQGVSDAVLETNQFSSQIVVQVDDNAIVNEGLTQLIRQTQDQISTIKKIDLEMEEQFTEYSHIDELHLRLNEVTYHAGNNIRRLASDAEFLFQGAHNLRSTVESRQGLKRVQDFP